MTLLQDFEVMFGILYSFQANIKRKVVSCKPSSGIFRSYLSPSAERRLKGLEYASFPDDDDEIMYKED